MDVILLEKIANLGDMGDKVSVKAGYGRNFLIPQGKALAATQENLAQFEARRSELEALAAKKLAAAREQQVALEALSINITAKAGDEGKLFGSIGARVVAEALLGEGVTVDKQLIILPQGPFRHTGAYEVTVNLHTDVVATVKVAIVPEVDISQ